MDDKDFLDLIKVVRVIRDNMELNYGSFRHTKELDESSRLLVELEKKYNC